jgi:Tripartite tricarboxylate transporter family receptor
MHGRFVISAMAATICLISAALAQDDSYPAHSVRLIVSSLPGGNPDVLGRLLADRMSNDFGKSFVVENVTGAGGALSAIAAAKASPDGYTLYLGDTGIMAINPLLNPDVGYDPMKDFTPITGLVGLPTILAANPKVQAATLSEFIALAKQEPGKITYGSAGIGSIHHMTMAIFAVSRRHRHGERPPDRRNPGRLVRHSQRSGADRRRPIARLLHQRVAALGIGAGDPDLRRTWHQGFRRCHRDGTIRADGDLAEDRGAPAGRNRQGHARAGHGRAHGTARHGDGRERHRELYRIQTARCRTLHRHRAQAEFTDR